MKRFLIAALAWIILTCTAFAQGPTTQWPYLFSEFRQGYVEINQGSTRPYQLNIHLRSGQLHYLDERGLIRETDISKVVGAKVGSKRFLQVGGEMMLVVAQSEHGCVVEEVLGDYAALSETGGAYGSSSNTSATRRLSSIEADSQINQNHMILMQSKEEGKSLDTISTYYFVYPGHQLKATRNDVEKSLSEEQAVAWKSWIKTHKIKWKQPESLIATLEFLNP